jgi:nucleolar protein 12
LESDNQKEGGISTGTLIPFFVPRCVSFKPGSLSCELSACAQVSTLPTSLTATPVPRNAGIKRSRDTGNGSLPDSVKRKKSAEAIDQSQSLTSKPATAEPLAKDSKNVKRKKRISEGSKTRSKTKDASEGSDEEEADGGLEEAYERRNRRPGKEGAPSTSKNKEGSERTSESEVDASQLVHETVARGDRHGKTRPTRRRIMHHDCPPDETKEQRDARTIFIGNVPVEVAKSKVCPGFFLTHAGLTYTGSLL